jgi:hypothetical protein
MVGACRVEFVRRACNCRRGKKLVLTIHGLNLGTQVRNLNRLSAVTLESGTIG